MPGTAIALLVGVTTLFAIDDLSPGRPWVLVLFVAAVVGVRHRRWRAVCLAFAVGFGWAAWTADRLVGARLPAVLEGRDLVVEGVVVTLPLTTERATRFVLSVERVVDGDGGRWHRPGRVRLNWYGRHRGPPAAGERWRLRVRLKRPHGLSNPGSFDYERWLFSRRIVATGYVRPWGGNRRLGAPSGLTDRWRAGRQELRERLAAAMAGRPNAGILTALAIGDRHGIEPRQWRTLNRTGTSHLVAISGLHVGLVAAWAFFLVRWPWSWSERLTARCPATHAGAVAGLLAALVYASLAGFSLPTLRATIMLAVAVIVILRRRRVGASRALSLALVIVLVIDPMAVLTAGFWLSFGAVATILAAQRHRLGTVPRWLGLARLHVLLALVLTPWLLGFFHQASIVAPLANLLAIPWVGSAIVPPTLMAVAALPFSPTLSTHLLAWADGATSWLWVWLDGLASLPGGHGLVGSPPFWAILLAAVGTTVLLLPRGWPGRWAGLVACLPMLVVGPPPPPNGSFDFVLLDVGQGLSAVVLTAGHVLVYDTGPRYGAGFDAGSGVVAPFLRSRGRERIDILVVGHGDSDHLGGAAGLRESIVVDHVLSSVPGRLPWPGVVPCRAGQRWRWDGVDFQVLHPGAGQAGGNDASCVLKVGRGRSAVLLTGDIEARAERSLLARTGRILDSAVLVVPHHGSATSSIPRFVEAVAPDYVLLSTGYGNRFGLPRVRVVERYEGCGAAVLDTAVLGAIGMTMGPGGLVAGPWSWRDRRRRFWRPLVRFRGRRPIQYDGPIERPTATR